MEGDYGIAVRVPPTNMETLGYKTTVWVLITRSNVQFATMLACSAPSVSASGNTQPSPSAAPNVAPPPRTNRPTVNVTPNRDRPPPLPTRAPESTSLRAGSWQILESQIRDRADRYYPFSKACVNILRHRNHRSTIDGSVDIRIFRDLWNQELLRKRVEVYGSEYDWHNLDQMIVLISLGSDRPRYEVFVPYDGTNRPTKIPSIEGHSGQRITYVDGSRGTVPVTTQDVEQLFHHTWELTEHHIRIDSIRPGGGDYNGRQERFFTIIDPLLENTEQYHNLQLPRPREHQVYHIPYKCARDVVIKIDVKIAIQFGCLFFQTASMAVVTSQTIPPEAVLATHDRLTGRLIYVRTIAASGNTALDSHPGTNRPRRDPPQAPASSSSGPYAPPPPTGPRRSADQPEPEPDG